MREIKFRAFDGRRMLFCGKDGHFDFIIEGGKISLFGEFDLRERKTPDWPLEQFTGLLDKNGVEIYEGAICNIMEHGKVTYSVVEVLFSGTYASFGYRGYYSGKGSGDFFGVRISGVKDVEVIGNIHQHPELLK